MLGPRAAPRTDADLELARELNPELKSFSEWLAEHKSEIVV
ncbi:hypothetical protein [Kribbella sp. VKM Ac-2568]|nr:hypothetical protein [Kribbella sp. VKM Ac-2568]TCM45321.1 hypothetical protein EV648_107475 [Kribbella sp. VKM Ac-2568]